MSSKTRTLLALAALTVSASWAGQALAWGDTGHRMVGVLAAEALPSSIPGFLRTPQAILDIGDLAREPDRSRGSGRTHDSDRDPGHFADGDDNGKLLGGPPLGQQPPTRAELEKQLQAAGTDSWKAGYLNYSIVEGWQQLVKDFALWRADAYGAKTARDPKHRAWLLADRIRREKLILVNLGVWAHFVGDASQPLHTTLHYNGWGGPNPMGFTQEHIHVPLEGVYVTRNVKPGAVKAAMRPYQDCGACDINAMTGDYLVAESKHMIPMYQLEKDGGFKDGDARGVDFMTLRLAEGAAELRDLVVDAWNASSKMTVGYPGATAADIEAGKAGDAYDLLFGNE